MFWIQRLGKRCNAKASWMFPKPILWAESSGSQNGKSSQRDTGESGADIAYCGASHPRIESSLCTLGKDVPEMLCTFQVHKNALIRKRLEFPAAG